MKNETRSNKSPAPDVAREVASRNGADHIVNTAAGVRVKLCPVSASLIDEVSNRIAEPEVPVWYNKEYADEEHPQGRPEENPSDPAYQRAIRDVARQRGKAAIDAMVMFGAELIDGLPQDKRWLRKLQFLGVSLEGYNLEDDFDLEFLYKRFVAIDSGILTKISELSGITPEDIELAESSFQGN